MIELIYTSITPTKLDASVVNNILTTAQHNNRLNNITGYLFYDGYKFLQILEGRHEKIYDLFNKIEADTRHENVEFLYEQKINTRSFPDWRMAYEPLQPHSLNNPMQNIETIHCDNHNKISEKPIFNIGSALLNVFQNSTIATIAP